MSTFVHLATTALDARMPGESVVVASSGRAAVSKNATYGERSRAACGDPLREPGIWRYGDVTRAVRRGPAA